MLGSGFMDVHTSVTKTYSRKRGRTRSTSSPSGLSPPEQDFRELKRKKTTPTMHTVTSGKTQIEDEDDALGQSRMKRLKQSKSSKTNTPPAPSVHVSTEDSLSFAQSQRNHQREDKIKMSLTSGVNSEKPLTPSLVSLAHRQTLPGPGSSKLNAFKRTNSQLQKENFLSRPNLLASPFHIAPPSSSKTHRSVKYPSGRLTPTSKMARRPSAGGPNTHSSASISFRRRPSGSHALQQKAVGNHDWLVPPSQHFQRSSNPSGQDDTELGMDQKAVRDVDITFSSFSPQCYSTPLVARRLPIEVAPTMPVFVKPSHLSANNRSETTINGGTSESTTIAQGNLDASNFVSFLGTTSPGSRKLIHLPHDSIFSSFDFSTSAAGIEPNITGPIQSPSRQGNITPQGPASSHIFPNPTNAIAEPEGEELQNMFSVLGLGEETLPHNSEAAPDAIPLKEATMEDHPSVHQKRKLRSAPPTSTGVENIEKPSSQQRRKRPRVLKHKDKQRSTGVLSSHRPAPRYSSRIDDEPLVANDDEDDELLLTSKGWDWVPPTSCISKSPSIS